MRRYRAGMFYALATTCLYAAQEPLSFLAAKQLPATEFVLFTQLALLLSLPLLLAKTVSRRDLTAILRRKGSYGRLGVILAITTIGLLLYNFGLGGSHPVIISATLSLAPFWGALAALAIVKVPIPGSLPLFLGCLAGAAIGAVVVAWSQSAEANGASSTLDALRKDAWVIAIPVPICTTLAGDSCRQMVQQKRRVGRDCCEHHRSQRRDDPGHAGSYPLARKIHGRRRGGDPPPDRRHDHCRRHRASLLPDRAVGDGRGQRLRLYVSEPPAGLVCAGLIRAVVLASRPSLPAERALFRRASVDRRVAIRVLNEVGARRHWNRQRDAG